MSEFLDLAVFRLGHLHSAAVTLMILSIFGRADLRISLSEAKFDAEADFEVRSTVAHQNPRLLAKNEMLDPKVSPKKKFQCHNITCPKWFETRFGKI